MLSSKLKKLLMLLSKKEFEQLQCEIEALSKPELIQVLGELTLLRFSEQTTLGGIRESLYVEMGKVVQEFSERYARGKELPCLCEFLDKDKYSSAPNLGRHYFNPNGGEGHYHDVR